MCGIAGAIGPKNAFQRDCVSRLLGRISHRGDPELCGEVANGLGWVIGANRMAINSINTAKQPIWSSNGSVVLVFNGEIYDYWRWASKYDLRSEDLRSFGDGFFLASAIAHDGIGVVSELAGMFAFIGIDVSRGMAFAARDSVGIKPLYYSSTGDCLLLASEIKALAPERDVREIGEIKPGTFIEVGLGNVCSPRELKSVSYFDLGCIAQSDVPVPSDTLRLALERSVQNCCSYNGPLGVYLSGGVDSGGIYALMLQNSNNVVPIIVGYEGSPDRVAASRLVSEIGKQLVVGVCPTEEELFSTVERTIEVVESFEPNLVRQSAVQRCIAAAAKSAGLRVILCGEGADELFCGYPEFYSPDTDWQVMRLRFMQDLHRTQLQRVDRCSMELTTEVRVPYLEKEVIEIALASRARHSFLGPEQDGKNNKLVLRDALKGVLPDWVRSRQKVVLSEGAGLPGNHPHRGLFAKLAGQAISTNSALEIRTGFSEWNLGSDEEALYFSIFKKHEYDKASFMRQRVMANREHSLLDRPDNLLRTNGNKGWAR